MLHSLLPVRKLLLEKLVRNTTDQNNHPVDLWVILLRYSALLYDVPALLEHKSNFVDATSSRILGSIQGLQVFLEIFFEHHGLKLCHVWPQADIVGVFRGEPSGEGNESFGLGLEVVRYRSHLLVSYVLKLRLSEEVIPLQEVELSIATLRIF